MKYILLLLTIVFALNANGQITMVDTPHCFSHSLHAEVTGGLIPTPSGITVDDGWSGVIPIGFTYNFYTVAHTQCIIGSNGCLGFNLANAGAYNTWPISATLATTGSTDIRDVICGPWCDVYIPAGGTIEYSTQGTAPNRNFAVTWCGTRMYSCTTEWLTTQIIIYETTGIAEVHIQHRTICLTGWNGQHAIVGVKNATGTTSTVAPGRDFPTVWAVAIPEGWRFTPAPGPTYTVTSIPYAPIPYATSSIYWYDSTTHTYLGTGPDITVNPLVPTTYEAVALGCNDSTKAFIHVLPATCFWTVSNNPCVGDSLKLFAYGDSLGYTYQWTGPAGFTSTQKNPVIYPATSANAGLYHAYKMLGTVVNAKDSVFVTIHPLPVVTLTSSIPNCAQITNPFNLYCALDSIGETFNWVGPFGFTSTLQNPVINPFDSSLAGTYVCTGTTVWGCKATNSINIVPGITPLFHPTIHFGCNFDTVYFLNSSVNANTYTWDFGDATPNDHVRNTWHVYNAHHVFTVTLTEGNPSCPDVHLPKTIDLTHDIHAVFAASPDTICLNGGAPITFPDMSYADDSNFTAVTPATWSWNFGDGIGTSLVSVPTYTYTAAGKFTVKLVVTDAMGCPDSMLKDVYVVQLHVTGFTDTLLCLSQPLALNNVVTTIPPDFDHANFQYVWSESSPNLDDTSAPIPHVSGFGTFTDIATITIPGIVPDGCPITDQVVIHSVQGAPLTHVTVSQTIDYGSSIQLYATGEVLYYWLPDDGSLDNNNINNPKATPEHTTTYTVFGLDGNGCLDSAYITVYVDTSMEDGVPCAFTPNHDGINDIFKPVGIKFQNMVEMRVFNRWGQEVFYTNSRENGWDGTYHGLPQDIGTYFYEIIVARPGGSNKVYKGPLTLIR